MKKLRGLFLTLTKVNSYSELCQLLAGFKSHKGFSRKHLEFLAAEKNFVKILIDNGFTLNDIRHALFENKQPEHRYCPICHAEIHADIHGYQKTCGAKDCHYTQVQKTLQNTNIEKYGVSCTLSVPEVQSKIKQTKLKLYGSCNNYNRLHDGLIQKYGVDCTWKIPGVNEKSKSSMLEHLGYEYALSSPDIRKRAKNTKMLKYGDENYCNFEKIRRTKLQRYGDEYFNNVQKAKETFTERYGVDNNMKSEKGLAEYCKSINIKYGVDFVVQTQDFRDKSIETCLEKYGVRHHMQNSEIRKKTRSKYTYEGINFDSSWELAFWIYHKDHHVEIRRPDISFKYTDILGKEHQYFPDFQTTDNQFIEIKGDDQFNEDGQMIDKLDDKKNYIAEAKHRCMLENNVKIIKLNEIKQYLDYIDKTYGKKYLKQFKNSGKQVK